MEGLGGLHTMVAEHGEEPSEVVVAIELDRGWLSDPSSERDTGGQSLPGLQVSGCHQNSGAKSDRDDAKVLADLVRTDRHNRREVAGDSELAEAIKVLTRAPSRSCGSASTR